MGAVLVIGATTPLGTRLLEALLAEDGGDPILAAGAEADPPRPALARPDRIRYEHLDLTRARPVKSLLFGPARALGVDTVIHAALHRSAARARHAHAQDVEGTRALLDAAERHPTIRRFVFRSYASVYAIDPRRPTLIDEQHPLDFSTAAPDRVRDRVEADVTVCTRIAESRLAIAVLRCAEILAPDMGSQLHDYLGSRVCLRPLGFDPMLNLLSLEDAARALVLALRSDRRGVFNVPGADTLPLSRAVALWGRRDVPVPGPLLGALYRLRATTLGMEFRYDVNFTRFHFGAVLDGAKVEQLLGYRPTAPIHWPCAGSISDRARNQPPPACPRAAPARAGDDAHGPEQGERRERGREAGPRDQRQLGDAERDHPR
jgi:UDP-glucose 4-epimerase